MSVCYKCNWPAVFSTWADGREWEFIPGVEGGKMFVQFLIIPGSQPLHKVLLWKDWTRLSSILSLPHCLGQVQLSALPRIVSWCDGPHKDEPIKTLTDILELNKLSDVAVDRRSLTGLFFKELQVTCNWKNSPRYHPLIGERRNYTVCISYSPLIAYLVIKRAYT